MGTCRKPSKAELVEGVPTSSSNFNQLLADPEPFPVEFILALVAIILVHLVVTILHHKEKFYSKIITFGELFFDSRRHQVDTRNDIMLQEISQPLNDGHSGKDMEFEMYIHNKSTFQ